jgi:hypothetical protein
LRQLHPAFHAARTGRLFSPGDAAVEQEGADLVGDRRALADPA